MTTTDDKTIDNQELESDGEFITGKIIRLDPSGYGFISSKDIEFTRIFFHWTALEQDTLNFKELKKGMIVEFKPIDFIDKEGNKKGWRAIKIRIVENENRD